MKFGIKGFYKVELHKAVLDEHGDQVYDEGGHALAVPNTGRVVCDWFPNVFLNSGRNEIALRGNWAWTGAWCQVGTNNTPPNPSQTGLLGRVAASNSPPNDQTDVSGAESTVPYYGWTRQTYRIPAGPIGNQNLNEVGIGWSDGTVTDDLVSRVLFVDALGDTTTIVPQVDEILDVTYEMRYYPPLGDVAGTVTLDSLVYDTLTRAANVTSDQYWGGIGGSQVLGTIGSLHFAAYAGAIGTVEQSPSGLSDDLSGTVSNSTYGNNDYYIDTTAFCGIDGWNPVGEIRCVVCTGNYGRYQTQFTAQIGAGPVPKTAAQSMSLTWRISWAGWLWDGSWIRSADDDVSGPGLQTFNTDTTQTLLRINWTDQDAANRREALKVPDGTTFHVQYDSDPAIWAEFTMDVATSWAEGASWTEYTVTETATGPGGAPGTGNICTIRALTP